LYYETSAVGGDRAKDAAVFCGAIHNLRIERVIDSASDARFPRLTASTGARRTARGVRQKVRQKIDERRSSPQQRGFERLTFGP